MALFLISLFLHILALIKLFPIFLSIPLLFAAVLLFILTLNNKNRFKGF